MATIVNTPAQQTDEGNGMWNFMGILLVVVAIFIFIFYGIPFIRSSMGNLSASQIIVPGKIDVNINQTK